jgi:type II secretory pathway pseudopilin PulG
MAREGGYALVEVFVAAAIAATTVVVVFSGLASGLRASTRAEATVTQLSELRSIEAGLRAGLPAATLVERYRDWQIDISPVDRPIDPRTGAVLSQARLVHTDGRGRTADPVTIVYVEDGALIRAGQP